MFTVKYRNKPLNPVKKSTYNTTSNPKLKTILPEDQWQGTPLHANGTFINHEFPFIPEFKEVIKWKSKKNPFEAEKKQDRYALEVTNAKDFFNAEHDGIMWLGHACFFIRIDGISILMDPVWHSLPFVKNLVKGKNYIDEIVNLDYLLISHDHRDHCDKKTIVALANKFPSIEIKTGLKMDALIKPWVNKNTKIECAGWYQEFTSSKVKLSFMPSRHWSKRGLLDANTRLWGGFVIEGNGRKIYFSGDTGYGNHFQTAREIFFSFDVAIIGIGAYEPRWFMHSNHISPEDAFIAFTDLNANIFLPMHYGTFDLSDEPPSQPINLLLQSAEKLDKINKIKPLAIGGVLEL
jgi:L-ascorbate metabolism protein UlaG (beta-lactamase superfamily)